MKKAGWLLAVMLMTWMLVGCSEEKAPQSFEYTKTETAYETEADGLEVSIELACYEEEDENARNMAVCELQTAYGQALEFLGPKYEPKKPIRCTIFSGDGLTQALEEELHIYYYETVSQPYTYYFIQMLVGFDAPDWLREGLAVYGCAEQGGNMAETFGASVEALKAYRTAEKEEEVTAVTITEMAQALYTAEVGADAMLLGDLIFALSQMEDVQAAEEYRAAYCIYAGSFVEYLAEEKGLDAVLKVYKGKEFDKVMGMSVEEAHQNWIKNKLEIIQ